MRLAATGICRSDLSYVDGKWPVPMPVVLGHEGAGTIEAVGDGVDPARIGERVVLTFSPACGACRFCLEGRANLCLDAAAGLDTGLLRDGSTRLSRDGVRVLPPRLRVVVREPRGRSGERRPADRPRARSRARVPARVRRHDRGHVRDAARRRPAGRRGRDLRLRRRRPVGRDRRRASSRRIRSSRSTRSRRSAQLALRLGATHAIDPADGDTVEQVRAIVPGGVDVVVRGARPSGDRRPGVPQRPLRRDDRPDRAAADGRQGRLRRVRRHAVRARRARLEPRRRGACAARPGARPARGRRASSRSTSLVTHRFPLDEINEAIEMTQSGDAGRVVRRP